ncbi:hypothetical protein EJ08DRAFT_98066 [Tothia fuscella]|uniref:Uncharacterized protein n=1 Tax=Tothia fuscella TaxID=1048955 RepID=A0A9P4TSE7_9PEZI|nr:hypothetical protein EJ08DRAFT_98066 [Tothia fuscella]
MIENMFRMDPATISRWKSRYLLNAVTLYTTSVCTDGASPLHITILYPKFVRHSDTTGTNILPRFPRPQHIVTSYGVTVRRAAIQMRERLYRRLVQSIASLVGYGSIPITFIPTSPADDTIGGE